MTATGHALVATLIAAKFANPYIAIPLAFISHIPCDILPHWDSGTHYKKKTKKRLFYEAATDVLISLVISITVYTYFFHGTDIPLLLGSVFAAQLLDWLSIPTLIFPIKNKFLIWVEDVQSDLFHTRLDKPWGVVTQVVAVIVLYLVLFKIF